MTDNNENTDDCVNNCYKVVLSGYFYHIISKIRNNGDFTENDIQTYGLSVTDDKIDISTTKKLINYLKAYVFKKLDDKADKTTVQSIQGNLTTVGGKVDNMWSTIYPVGAVYMSVNDTNPSVLFGGTWAKIEGRFLIGASSDYPVQQAGGEATHTLTVDEMPSHTHEMSPHQHIITEDPNIGVIGVRKGDDWGYSGKRKMKYESGSYYYPFSTKNTSGIGEYSTTSANKSNNYDTGGSKAHNNIPPYYAVYMWRRLS